MEAFRYRGRVISVAEVEFIRQLMAAHPGASRRALSQKLCEAWGWRQANGALRDGVCRGLLLRLDRAGPIALPAARWLARPAQKERPRPALAVEATPLRAELGAIQPLEFQQVRCTPEEALFNSLLEQHHYLGYTQPVGEHLKYIV